MPPEACGSQLASLTLPCATAYCQSKLSLSLYFLRKSFFLSRRTEQFTYKFPAKLTDKSQWITKASSQYTHYGNSKERAVDTIVSTGESCCHFHSGCDDVSPWLQVEMEASYRVTQVDVYNRLNTIHTVDFEYIQVRSFVSHRPWCQLS